MAFKFRIQSIYKDNRIQIICHDGIITSGESQRIPKEKIVYRLHTHTQMTNEEGLYDSGSWVLTKRDVSGIQSVKMKFLQLSIKRYTRQHHI